MKSRVFSLALVVSSLVLAGSAHAGIIGNTTPQGDVVRLKLMPEADVVSQRSSLFVGIVQMMNGAPNLAAAGWYDGRSWKASGMPIAAFTGQIPNQVATITVPGGVCALVRSAGGPAGVYALYAGWGRLTAVSAGLDEAEINEMIKTAEPEIASQLQRLMGEYRAALERSKQYSATDSVAFSDMRTRNTFWQIKQFECGSNR